MRGGGSWERDGCSGEQSLRHPPGRRPHHRGPAPSVGARRAVGDTGEPSVQCLARRHHSDPARQSPERGRETAARGGGVSAASFPGALLPPGGQAREGGPGPPAPRTPRLPSCPHPAQDPRRPHVGFRDGGPPLLQAGSAQGPTAPVSGGGGGLLGCPGVHSSPPGKGRGQGGDCGVAGCSGCSHDAGVWRAESQGREAGRVGLGLCPQRPPRRRCARAGTIHRAPSGRWTVFASHYVAELAGAARTAAECSLSGGLINQGPAGGSGASKVIRGGRRPAPPCWAAGPDPRVPA